MRQAISNCKPFGRRCKRNWTKRLLAESREQYLRYALSIWEDYVEKDGHRDPARAVQALDVLCLLFEGE